MDLNKREIVKNCELASFDNQLVFIDANDDLKLRGLIEEESRFIKPLSSESQSAETVSATSIQSTCGSSAASKLDIHNSLKHHENYASGIKIATPNLQSQVSHWFPLSSDREFYIGNLGKYLHLWSMWSRNSESFSGLNGEVKTVDSHNLITWIYCNDF